MLYHRTVTSMICYRYVHLYSKILLKPYRNIPVVYVKNIFKSTPSLFYSRHVGTKRRKIIIARTLENKRKGINYLRLIRIIQGNLSSSGFELTAYSVRANDVTPWPRVDQPRLNISLYFDKFINISY